MGSPAQGGAARAMAAVVTAVAALAAATAPPAAAEGPPAGAAGAVALPADAAAVNDLASALVQEAVQDAPAVPEPVAPPAVDEAFEIAAEAADESAAGQYQPQEPQYHEQDGQYHQPPVTPDAPPPSAGEVPPPSADEVSVATAAPINVNVSVRVLSPGSDAAVTQGSAPVPSPVSATPAPQAATATSGGAANVTISVTVNLAVNWNIILPGGDTSTRYQSPDNQYHNAHQIESMISASTGVQIPAATPAPTEVGGQPSTAHRAADEWATVVSRGAKNRVARQPTASRMDRRGTTRGPESSGREASATEPGVVAASSFAAWARAPQRVRRSTPHDGDAERASRSRPARMPSVPVQYSPEPLAGAATSAGGAFATFYNTLAVLVAALGLAALRSTRRLRLPSRRLQEAYGPRPEKPG
jgi:hypothetical protein